MTENDFWSWKLVWGVIKSEEQKGKNVNELLIMSFSKEKKTLMQILL